MTDMFYNEGAESDNGDIQVLTEVACLLEIFFQGLSGCGLLTSYGVQLQASALEPCVQRKFMALLRQLQDNLKDLLSKLPIDDRLVQDASTQTGEELAFESTKTEEPSQKSEDMEEIWASSGVSRLEHFIGKVDTSSAPGEVLQEARTEVLLTDVYQEVSHPRIPILTPSQAPELPSLQVEDHLISTKELEEQVNEVHVMLTSSSSHQPSSGHDDSPRAEEEILECSECDKMFKSPSSLESHKAKSHMGPQSCDMCGQTFPSTSALQEHCRVVHKGQGCFQCSICQKRFMLRLSYRRHLDTHAGSKMAVCEVCGKTFKRADYLQRHYMIHSGERPHSCSDCGKSFVLASHLKKHKAVHNEDRSHCCKVCGRSFSRADKLKEHILRHLNVKRYQCSTCNKDYAERRDLRKHIVKHKFLCASLDQQQPQPLQEIKESLS